MNNVITAYDLGSFLVAESCQKVSIDQLVRNARKVLKKRLVEAQIEALGVSVKLTTSKTRFNGERLWFQCPICEKRVGTLFEKIGIIGCRKCLGLYYMEQRYKGMIESSV